MKKLLLILALLIPIQSYGLGIDYLELRGHCAVWKMMNYLPEQSLVLIYSKDGIKWDTLATPELNYEVNAVRIDHDGYYKLVLCDNSGFNMSSTVLKVKGLERAVMPSEVIYRTKDYQLTNNKEIKLL